MKLRKKLEAGMLRFVDKQSTDRYMNYCDRNRHPHWPATQLNYMVACDLLKKNEVERAARLNAEICFNKGNAISNLRWKERIMLVGLLAAYLGDVARAANWLSTGVKAVGLTRLKSRCCTYGYPADYVNWVCENERKFTTTHGWMELLQKSTCSTFEATRLQIYIAVMVHSLGLQDDVTHFLHLVNETKFGDWKKVLLSRSPNTDNRPLPLFTADELWNGEYKKVEDKIQLNIISRIFSSNTNTYEIVTQTEQNWLAENGHTYTESRRFLMLSRAFRLLTQQQYGDVIKLLRPEMDKTESTFAKLREAVGPLKVFVGGYGWTGSSAVYDALRGYPGIEEMPGVGNVPFLNEGADSEPMLHQGPAGILHFYEAAANQSCIPVALLQQFFRLYGLMGLHRDYFEYKTIHANREIANRLGFEKYNLILLRFVYQLAQTTNAAQANRNNKKPPVTTIHSLLDAVKNFERNIVMSLFGDSHATVLLNNSINTNNIRVLSNLSGRSVYIAVNRNIFDQIADQRRSNIFFAFSPLRFAWAKRKKVAQYHAARKAVARATNIKFIDVDFDKWVKSKEYRIEVTNSVIGDYSQGHENKFFDPSQSIKNVDIYDRTSKSLERVILTLAAWVINAYKII